MDRLTRNVNNITNLLQEIESRDGRAAMMESLHQVYNNYQSVVVEENDELQEMHRRLRQQVFPIMNIYNPEMDVMHISTYEALLVASFNSIRSALPGEGDQNDIKAFAGRMAGLYNYYILLCSVKRSTERLIRQGITYGLFYQHLVEDENQRVNMRVCGQAAKITYNLVKQVGPALLVKPEWFKLYHQQPTQICEDFLAREDVQQLCRRLRQSGEYIDIYSWLDINSQFRDL